MDKKTTYQRKLFSANEKEVIDVLHILKENGYPEIIPDIIKVYIENNSLLVKEQALYILNNLKDKEAVPYFIKGIELSIHSELRPHLISACWQNGLDFSSYLSYFIKVVAFENIESAIEAYSVIESNIALLKKEQQVELKNEIKDISKTNRLKNVELFNEIIKLAC